MSSSYEMDESTSEGAINVSFNSEKSNSDLYVEPASVTKNPTSDLNSSLTAISLSELIDNCSLKEFLDIVPGGKTILLVYNNQNELNSVHRNSLVHIIIDRFIDIKLRTQTSLPHSFHIKPNEFQALAKEIIHIFPNKIEEVYYSPYETVTIRGKKIRKNATGKLLDYFCYRKRVLQQDGIILKPEETSVISDTESAVDDPSSVEDWENCDQAQVDHTWLLEGNIEPEEVLLEKWKNTWLIRRKILQDKNISVAEYFSKYPCLSFQFGIGLINSDFDQLHPGKVLSLRDKWPNLRHNLIKLILKEVKSPYLQNIVNTSNDQQDAVIIVLLPKIIKPSAIKRKIGCDVKKPSIHEAETAFILITSIPADIQSSIDALKEEFFKKKLHLQPFLLFVGNPTVGFSEFYVILDNFKFQFKTALDAVDYLFKLFFAVDIEYPAYCYHLWQFIQIVGFEITDPTQKIDVKLKVLCNQLKSQPIISM